MSVSIAAPSERRGLLKSRVAIVTVALLAAFFAWLPAAPAIAAPTANITPNAISATEANEQGFAFTLVEFPASTPITITMNGEPVRSDGLTTFSDGNFRGTVTTDTVAPAGTYTVVFTAGAVSASDTITISAAAPATNTGGISLVPDIMYQSEYEVGGMDVSVTGFEPNTTVALWLDGRAVSILTTDALGIAQTNIGGSIDAGEHTLLAISDGTRATESFTVITNPNPQITLSASTITTGDLAGRGLVVTGTGWFTKSTDTTVDVSISGGNVRMDDVAVNADGTFTTTLKAASPTSISPSDYNVLALQNGGSGLDLNEARQPLTVTDGPATEVPTPAATVAPSSITATALMTTGVTVSGTGFNPASPLTINFNGAEAAAGVTVNADGTFEAVITNTQPAGTVAVSIVQGGTEVATTSFTVTADQTPVPADATLTTASATISAADLANWDKGLGYTVSGLPEGFLINEVLLDGAAINLPAPPAGGGSGSGDAEVSGPDGVLTGILFADGYAAGEHELSVTLRATDGSSADLTVTTTFTITADSTTPPATAPTLTLGQKSITVADFLNEDVGLTVVLEGFTPGADYTITVSGLAGSVTDVFGTDGTAVHQIFGRGTINPGTYTLTVVSGGVTLSTTFEVTAQAGGSGGGSGSGSDEDPNQLAATGGELNVGALAAAGALMALGAGFAIRGRRTVTTK